VGSGARRVAPHTNSPWAVGCVNAFPHVKMAVNGCSPFRHPPNILGLLCPPCHCTCPLPVSALRVYMSVGRLATRVVVVPRNKSAALRGDFPPKKKKKNVVAVLLVLLCRVTRSCLLAVGTQDTRRVGSVPCVLLLPVWGAMSSGVVGWLFVARGSRLRARARTTPANPLPTTRGSVHNPVASYLVLLLCCLCCFP
jgi:hypothetical protein